MQRLNIAVLVGFVTGLLPIAVQSQDAGLRVFLPEDVHRIREVGDIAISPDGDWIAARKHFTTTRSLGTGEIWLYHRDGGGGVPVIERPGKKHQKELGEPAFSPDGRYLYFSVDSTPGGTFQYAQDSNGQIYEIRRHDLETGCISRMPSSA